MKENRKLEAIRLRKKGRTYSEILLEVPVAKSTLASWFKSAGLAKPQKQRITALRKAAARRGADARRSKRLAEMYTLNQEGKERIGTLSKRELFLVGVALYWAEGSKQRQTTVSTGIQFTNSDPGMLSTFLAWRKVLGVDDDRLIF